MRGGGVTYGLLPGMRVFPVHVHVRHDEYISPQIARHHVWEPFETRLLTEVLRAGDFFLDIGANIGWHTCVAAMKVGNAGKIEAYEPDRVNFNVLQKNVIGMRRFSGHSIEAYNCALGDACGMGRLYLAPGNMGDHRIFQDEGDRPFEEVAIRTLDSLYYGKACLPTVVKMDTQGAEMAVLRGAEKLFAGGWRPVILFELWPYGLHRAGDDPEALCAFMRAQGYELFEMRAYEERLARIDAGFLRRRLEEMGGLFEHYMDVAAFPAGYEMDAVRRIMEG